jgi:hypothetical protein
MSNGTACLHAAAFHTKLRCSSLIKLIEYVRPHFETLPCDPSAVISAIDNLGHPSQQYSDRLTQRRSLHLLVLEDLHRIREVIETESFQGALRNELPFENNFAVNTEKASAFLGDLGLYLKKPKLFVVEDLPPPYHRANYKAAALDRSDLTLHGIDPGIYFVRRYLVPFYSTSLLFHELIHPIAAEPDSLPMGRGLEEGLAEVLGSMYLTMKVLGRNVATDIFISHRLRFGYEQFWEIYLDFTRQAVYLYKRFGLVGLAAILQGGRKKIKEVELLLQGGLLEEIDLPSGHWDDDLTRIVDLSFTFARNLVVSPLACVLFPSVAPGRSVADILVENDVEYVDGNAALLELQNRAVLAVVSDSTSTISSSDAFAYRNLLYPRYEII